MRITAALLGLVLCFSACEGGCGEAPATTAPESGGQTVSGTTGGGGRRRDPLAPRQRGDQTLAPAKTEAEGVKAAAPQPAPATAAQATTLADLRPADFDRTVLKNTKPVLVLYVTPSCRPCSQVEFALSGLTPEYAGKVSFARVDLNQPGAFELLPAGLRRLPLPAFAFYQDGSPTNIRQGLPVAGDASTHLKNWLRRIIEGRDVRL